jgi:ferritin-like metal-binding protein YciE
MNNKKSFERFAMKSWNELLAYEVRDLHDAELQLIEVLPRLARAADAPELKEVLEDHLAETQLHVERLERVAEILQVKLGGNITCAAMEHRIRESMGILRSHRSPDQRDAALIGAARKVESFEKMGYESAIDHAGMLGHGEVVELLRKTLDEEVAASQKLAALWEEMDFAPALAEELALAW